MSDDVPMKAFLKIWDAYFPHFPTRDEFLASILRQNFSLPDSMIYYILKNPCPSKVYQKLIQCCKYFFLKNPILVYHCLQIYDDGGWKTCSGGCRKREPLDMANVKIKTPSSCKLWVEDRLHIFSINSNYASDLVPRIYQCDAKDLDFDNQELSLPQLLFYSQYAKTIRMVGTVVNSDVHSEVPVEDIIANFPNLEQFYFKYDPNSSTNVSKDTVEKLFKIAHFKNIYNFTLYPISEKFDIDRFYDYYKNQNPDFLFLIDFKNLPSEDYARKLDEYIDEMLSFKDSGRLISYIRYPGQDIAKEDALWDLYIKSYRSLFQ